MLSQITSGWAKELADYIKISDFVSEFEDRFLVIVFGKVNSGKSTLGRVFSKEAAELKARSPINRLNNIKSKIAGSAIFTVETQIDAIVNSCADNGTPAAVYLEV